MGKFATAVALVVEGVFAEELVAAFLQTSLAPVARPEMGAGDGSFGGETCTLNLVEALPAGRGEGGGEGVDAQLHSLACCRGEAQAEAELAACPTLRFTFEAADGGAPTVMIPVVVDPRDA